MILAELEVTPTVSISSSSLRRSTKEMINRQNIKIETSKHVEISEWTFRDVAKDHPEDNGLRFEALIKNKSDYPLEYIECELRYFNEEGKFLGVDEYCPLSYKELNKQGDCTISFMPTIPEFTNKGTVVVKAQKKDRFDGWSMWFFGACFLIGAILFFID
tara:strand:+ start:73 stop:552 length:480 start_codon:yes stop_codon:yes gene_type:complete